MCVNSGNITLLSTSNILNPPSSKSDSGIIYESNSIDSSSYLKNQGIDNFNIIGDLLQ